MPGKALTTAVEAKLAKKSRRVTIRITGILAQLRYSIAKHGSEDKQVPPQHETPFLALEKR